MRTAAEAVVHNKLRAGLTSLGILFGVASVIAMLAVGRGAKQEILTQMQLLGTNNVVITPRQVTPEQSASAGASAKPESKRFSPGLTMLDAHAIVATVPQVEAASGEIVVATTIARK